MSGIIVGVDGSGHSTRALDWAAREATILQVPLTVLTVHQVVIGYWGAGIDYPRDHAVAAHARDLAQKETDKVLAGLADQPPSVIVRSVSGVPSEELVNAAEDADMLVVGARGAGGFARLLLGSVSTQVTHHSRCPVVVIPAENRK